jgi:hypothetical protein
MKMYLQQIKHLCQFQYARFASTSNVHGTLIKSNYLIGMNFKNLYPCTLINKSNTKSKINELRITMTVAIIAARIELDIHE